ncbi:sialate:O-sulfotransferase 1-like, partial [Convolutriloba macropyga]|uniref:sialate:O-sulfotransferase 1-like n=1 Tax=Convolutriloba macropyga TaxID=536237 RepID=UPI003F523B4F
KNLFLGCLPADQINKVDGKTTIRVWKGKNYNHVFCKKACELRNHSIAVLSIRDISGNETSCTCLESLWKNIFDVTDTDWPNLCENGAYVTSLGLSKCDQGKLLDLKQTAVPQVALISVPGSGAKWTRNLFQKMTGVRAGGFAPGSFNDSLHNIMIPRSEKKSALEFHNNPNQKSTMSDKADKVILLIRNPFQSSLAEYSKTQNNTVAGFTDVRSFLNQNKIHSFADFFKNQLNQLLQLVTTYAALKKPVMFLFYEDMADNLLRKLMELAEFVGLGQRTEILDRSICTVLSNSIAKDTQRVFNADLISTAAKLIDKKHAIETLVNIRQVFVNHNCSFKRIDEYLLSIEKL